MLPAMRRRSAPDPDEASAEVPGRVIVTPVMIGDLRGLVIDIPVEPTELPACLTDAEREVVTLLLEGRSNHEIATMRGCSYRTIANQLASIYRKLGVTSRTELIARLGARDAGS